MGVRTVLLVMIVNGMLRLPCGPLAALILLSGTAGTALAQPASAQVDPFATLARLTGTPVRVAPRALAVIPERHTGRLIQLTDTLERVDPNFSDIALGAGLSHQRAIQLRTQDARVPIFVQKTQATISTVLQLQVGAPIEVQGILVERGGRFFFLATDVRPGTTTPARRRRRGR
jgi:hypothetical protein